MAVYFRLMTLNILLVSFNFINLYFQAAIDFKNQILAYIDSYIVEVRDLVSFIYIYIIHLIDGFLIEVFVFKIIIILYKLSFNFLLWALILSLLRISGDRVAFISTLHLCFTNHKSGLLKSNANISKLIDFSILSM